MSKYFYWWCFFCPILLAVLMGYFRSVPIFRYDYAQPFSQYYRFVHYELPLIVSCAFAVPTLVYYIVWRFKK